MAFEYFLRKRVLELRLDRPFQRASAENRIETSLSKLRQRRIGDLRLISSFARRSSR